MNEKKSQNDISIDDLLKALDTKKPDASDVVVDDDDIVLAFIQTFKIEEGNYKIHADLIYRLFTTWAKKPVNKGKFFTEFKKYFQPYDTTRVYKLNKDINDIVKHFKDQKTIFENKISNRSILSKAVQANFKKFLQECDIKNGPLYVEADIFYHVYDTWCYRNRKKPLSYLRFSNMAQLFFDYKRFKGSLVVWFALDPSIKQHIDKNAVLNWRTGRKKRGEHEKYKVEGEDRNNIIYPEAEVDSEGTE